MFDYAGCIHFHSAYSYDARIPLPRILEDARKTKLNFVVVTDHFRMDARKDHLNGYQDGLLVIVGEEISPRYNHYLAFGIHQPIVVWKTEMNVQRIIDHVNAQGGFGFISHPDHAGAPLMGGRAYPWIDWNVRGYAGIGIWDLMSDWSSSLARPWRAILAWLRPAQALKGPAAKTLARWDELAQKGHCVAIGESDNHGHTRSFFGIRRTIFPFEFAFRTIRTHVLLDKPLAQNADIDERAILAAIKKGQSYVSFDLWNDPTGFSFRIFHDTREALSGGEINRQGETILETKLPSPGRIRLIRDGRVVKEERKRSALQWDVDMPGVYRVEALQHVAGKWRPWIFSNPIWVR